eukprot:COSAG06_NODE_1757_length_8456_cov_13.708867_3_plen_153_part_00
MYIKSVTVHGFKSYKENVTIELSPGCNVVVGRNGAGKSNFFAAIRFVLGDIFTNLRAEERQQLLHEGAGLAVMTAYVEVIFDNGDNRFPVRPPAASRAAAPTAPLQPSRRSDRAGPAPPSGMRGDAALTLCVLVTAPPPARSTARRSCCAVP